MSADFGWIYIMGACGTGLAKIGFASNPKARFAVMSTDCPYRLQLLYLKEGANADERALLDRFRPLRSHRSWFHLKPGNELDTFVLKELECPFHLLNIDDVQEIRA